MSDFPVSKSEIANDILTLERFFEAPPERVFEAFASAEAISKWFGPEGCEVLEAKVDFREGGRYRLRITTEDEGEIDLVGVYQMIDRPDRLAFSWRWENHPGFKPCDSFVEIVFQPRAEGTLFRLVQTGIEDEESQNSHVIGWSSTLIKLKRIVCANK